MKTYATWVQAAQYPQGHLSLNKPLKINSGHFGVGVPNVDLNMSNNTLSSDISESLGGQKKHMT